MKYSLKVLVGFIEGPDLFRAILADVLIVQFLVREYFINEVVRDVARLTVHDRHRAEQHVVDFAAALELVPRQRRFYWDVSRQQFPGEAVVVEALELQDLLWPSLAKLQGFVQEE